MNSFCKICALQRGPETVVCTPYSMTDVASRLRPGRYEDIILQRAGLCYNQYNRGEVRSAYNLLGTSQGVLLWPVHAQQNGPSATLNQTAHDARSACAHRAESLAGAWSLTCVGK
jgi:hypothetical protein